MTVLVLAWIYMIGTMLCIVFTLTFDSSPIKGEGDAVGWFVPTLLFPGYAISMRRKRHTVNDTLTPMTSSKATAEYSALGKEKA